MRRNKRTTMMLWKLTLMSDLFCSENNYSSSIYQSHINYNNGKRYHPQNSFSNSRPNSLLQTAKNLKTHPSFDQAKFFLTIWTFSAWSRRANYRILHHKCYFAVQGQPIVIDCSEPFMSMLPNRKVSGCMQKNRKNSELWVVLRQTQTVSKMLRMQQLGTSSD